MTINDFAEMPARAGHVDRRDRRRPRGSSARADAEDESVAPARDLETITLSSTLDAIRHDARSAATLAASGRQADAAARIADEPCARDFAGRTLRDLIAE
jgi:hypothetical protein